MVGQPQLATKLRDATQKGNGQGVDMATTSATGNQGSTGDQDPEPQQEILAPAAGIRPPATARAGDAGQRLVREDMARDQADQGRAPVPVQVNRGRANRRRRAARCGRWQPRQDGETDQGGDPGGEYEGYEDRQAQNAAGNAGGPTRPRSAGSLPSKRTWTDCLISTRTRPRTPSGVCSRTGRWLRQRRAGAGGCRGDLRGCQPPQR